MEKAVEKYRQRRQKRLDAKAIEQYKMRRDERLLSRFDDDDDGEKNVGGKKHGGHGNTKIPYGLCQREGIQIDPKWTPKDAWEALAGKGYSAGDVYKELKEKGKIGLKKAKKALTKLVETHFPAGMLGSSKKNTMEFANYINEHCEDADISEFLSLGNSSKAQAVLDFKCKKTKSLGKSRVEASWYVVTGDLAKITVTIPQLTGIKNESEKAVKARIFAHEWTHYIDLVSGDENKKYFSETFSKLNDVISASDTKTIGKEIQEKFNDFNAKCDAEQKERRKKQRAAPQQIVSEMFGERPNWIDERGGIRWLSVPMGQNKIAKKYEKRRDAKLEELNQESQIKIRATGDGIDTLQGIYDSLSLGQCREKGTVK